MTILKKLKAWGSRPGFAILSRPDTDLGRRSTFARNLPRHTCTNKGWVGACVWAERGAGRMSELTGMGDAACRLWGHPKRLMYSWQTTQLTIPQVIGLAGCFTLSALLFLATFQLAVVLWSSSQQWDLSRSQATEWSFWESCCLLAEKGHSQLTDCTARVSAKVQLPTQDHQVSDKRMTVCQGRWHTGRRKSLGPRQHLWETTHQPRSIHLQTSCHQNHVNPRLFKSVELLLLSLKCIPNRGDRFSDSWEFLPESKLFLLEEIGFSPITHSPQTHAQNCLPRKI